MNFKNWKKLMVTGMIAATLATGIAVPAQAASTQATGTVQLASTTSDLKTKADSIIKKNTKKTDTKRKKLEKLFKYVEKNYSYGRMVDSKGNFIIFKQSKGWEKKYALTMLKKKSGSCYHYAAAYAVLAQRATGYTTRVGVGKTTGFTGKKQAHAWTEIKIKGIWYVCDTNMDKFAAKSSMKYYLKKRSKLKSTYNNYKSVNYTTVKA